MAHRWLTRNSRRRRQFSAVFSIVIALLALATMFAELGAAWWFFDALAHFRWQYIAASLVAALGVWMTGPRALVVIAGAVISAQVPSLAYPGRLSPAEAANSPDRLTIRLVTANVHWDNRSPERVVRFIAATRPDIVVLQEVARERWQATIEILLKTYPHVAPAEWRDSGDLILSRYPIVERDQAAFPGHAKRTKIVLADIAVHGQTVRVAGVHPPVPLSSYRFASHNLILRDIETVVRDTPMPVVVAGDFNLTPWSPRFPAFLAASGLRRADTGWLWPYTWPAPSGWFFGGTVFRGFPIDHILVSRHFGLRAASDGPDIGSDHRPVIADLTLAR